MTTYVEIGYAELAAVAGLLLINLLLSIALRLGLTRDLLVASIRMVVQLLLVGLVLDWVFATRDPWVILAIATLMAGLAGVAAITAPPAASPASTGTAW